MSRFSSYFAIVSARGKLLAFMNFAFFTCVFVVAIASEVLLPPALFQGWQPRFPEIIFGDNFVFIFFSIFLSNLVLSAFVFVTLPGFVLFPFSVGLLVFRGFLWGVLLPYEPTWLVLVAIPTIVVEGEGYALAAVGGTIVGASWIRPKWFYSEEGVTRFGAFRKALKECVAFYVVVTVVLLVAAVIETVTLLMIS